LAIDSLKKSGKTINHPKISLISQTEKYFLHILIFTIKNQYYRVNFYTEHTLKPIRKYHENGMKFPQNYTTNQLELCFKKNADLRSAFDEH
jgi:hypothetical protein